jgi:hypothetical protein
VRSRAPTETKYNRERLVPSQKKCGKASKRVPTLPLRLGGYCRVPKLGVPPTLLNTAGNHPQHEPQRLMGMVQVKASSTQGTRSRLARAQPRAGNCSPGRSYVSPEGLLRQWAYPRHARGPARAGFVEKQPWPNRLSNRPYRRRIQCEDLLTPYPDTRASVGKVEVTAVTSPFH